MSVSVLDRDCSSGCCCCCCCCQRGASDQGETVVYPGRRRGGVRSGLAYSSEVRQYDSLDRKVESVVSVQGQYELMSPNVEFCARTVIGWKGGHCAGDMENATEPKAKKGNNTSGEGQKGHREEESVCE